METIGRGHFMLKMIKHSTNPLELDNIVSRTYNEENNVWLTTRDDGKVYVNNLKELKKDYRDHIPLWKRLDSILTVDFVKSVLAKHPIVDANNMRIRNRNKKIIVAFGKLFVEKGFNPLTSGAFKGFTNERLPFQKDYLIWMMRNDLVEFDNTANKYTVDKSLTYKERRKKSNHRSQLRKYLSYIEGTAEWLKTKNKSAVLKKYNMKIGKVVYYMRAFLNPNICQARVLKDEIKKHITENNYKKLVLDYVKNKKTVYGFTSKQLKEINKGYFEGEKI